MAGGSGSLAIGDAHPGVTPAIHAEPALGVEQGTATPGVALRRFAHVAGELGRDAIAQLVRLFVTAVALRQILLVHQKVDRLGHAVDAEHGHEAILFQQPSCTRKLSKKPDSWCRKAARASIRREARRQ